MTSVTLWCCR